MLVPFVTCSVTDPLSGFLSSNEIFWCAYLKSTALV